MLRSGHVGGESRRALLVGLGSLGVALVGQPPSALARAGRGYWPNASRAAVSLTYDDGLNSQLDNAAPELDALGLKATFFLTEENCAERLADWIKLAHEGHEMADHTVSHPCELKRFRAADFRAWAEVVKAREPGTLQYTLNRSREDPQLYFTVELFADQAAVEDHIRNFQARPAGPDLFDEPPKIQVFDKIV